ncbi:MAG: protein rep [Alphaproteobacteria bacterium]|nr:protein rep [Alphaproteobacteria bacterium]
MAGRLLPHDRVASCGQKTFSAAVGVHIAEGRAFFQGVETCGSVWHCPVCASKIAEKRRVEVGQAIDRHFVDDGMAIMVTFTIPHHAYQRPEDLKKAVSEANRKLTMGAPWMRAKQAVGYIGHIRALEVTHGQNGWHPHLHVLYFVKGGRSQEQLENFRLFLFERWARIIDGLGFGTCSIGAFGFEIVERPDEAGMYVTKWGVESELTKGWIKDAKDGGRSPWQLLKAANDGDQKAARLFQDYANAFKGTRQLTWSRGLKKRYKIDEREDDVLASETPSGNLWLGNVEAKAFRVLAKQGRVVDLLEAAEAGGWLAVEAYLAHHPPPYAPPWSGPS